MFFKGVLSFAALLPGLIAAHEKHEHKSDHTGHVKHHKVPSVKSNNTGPITLEAALWDKGFGPAEVKVYNNGVFVNTKKSVHSGNYCPITNYTIAACKEYNSTLAWFEVGTKLPNTVAPLLLSTHVPGGQVLYVNETTGALQFTNAHSDYPLNGKTPLIPTVSFPGGEALSLINEFGPRSPQGVPSDFYFCETKDKHQYTVNVMRPESVKCLRGYIMFRYTFRGEKSSAWQYE